VTLPDDLHENYRRGRFGGRLGGGQNPALLLVDACVAYLDADSPLYAGPGAEAAADACRVLLEGARAAGRSVLHTRIELASPGDGGLFARKVPALEVFRTGGHLGAPAPGLEPRPSEVVVTKQYASAFFGTSLASALAVAGVDALVIGGFSTSGCVRASALDAMQHGFIPLVVGEACGDRHQAPHDSALFDLDSKYADVIDVPTALDVLGGRPL